MSQVQQTAKVQIDLESMEVVEDGGETYVRVNAPDLVAHIRELRRAAGLEGVGVSVGVSVP